MENKIICLPGKKGLMNSLCKDRELSDDNSSKFSDSQPKKLIKRANSQRTVVIDVIQSQANKAFLKDIFFRRVHGFNHRIPRHVVSVDEKYLRRCLEYIHMSALKAGHCNTPVNLGYTNTGILSESYADLIRGDACDSGELFFECPEAAGTRNGGINDQASEHWTIGTVMGSKSMINILSNPLFHQFQHSDSNNRFSRMNLTDDKGFLCYDFTDSPSGLSISSHKLEKEAPMMKSHKFCSASANRNMASTSSSGSTCSDQLSSTFPIPSHAMLRCKWRKGIPHFVFSTDDQKEVYMAILRKVDPADVKALDYVYLFYRKRGGQKGCQIPDNDLQLVGKMNVSTTSTLGPNNYKVLETAFVVFGNNENHDREIYASSHTQRKNKGLSKVSQVFRTSPSSKRRALSNFGGSGAIVESCPLKSYALRENDVIETNVPPNFELAAIVVKDLLPYGRPGKVGGWGLNFLNKSGVKQTTLPSESSQKTSDCLPGMNILIPAGQHGGPRTRKGGPSSLIDRWRSGGCCDCGGWDEGCPLTVLQRRSFERDFLPQVDMQGECKSVDLVKQGSGEVSSTLRMEKVHDDLYYIHFQPLLSPLQSLSIAVAIVHSQSPTLRPASGQDL
ncbi:uncharacterized protein LOC114737204 isoform X1 [Neltuma alba]|uniref:uncharacterized protein LOC114737204 isoform X1 n=1 Tax=Neltuma alba TaxID=207710 RepID=UPI0010A35415|nr:uncharacterized protein LOC114737204 isoform X1 [Prosopis alba]